MKWWIHLLSIKSIQEKMDYTSDEGEMGLAGG